MSKWVEDLPGGGYKITIADEDSCKYEYTAANTSTTKYAATAIVNTVPTACVKTTARTVHFMKKRMG